MPINYPGSADTLTNPVAADLLSSPSHATQHANVNDIAEALEAKVGIGASTPTKGKFLIGSAAGASTWSNTAQANAASDVPLVLKGAASQTANYVEVQDSAGNVLLKVLPHSTGGQMALGITSPEALLHVYRSFPAPPSGGATNAAIQGHLHAIGTATTSDQNLALRAMAIDSASVVNKTITGAADNGSGLIRITATAHGFATGDKIAVYAVGGTTEANGAWTITVINANTFDLQGSTFTNAYTSGGTATNRPYLAGLGVTVAPIVGRGGLTGTAANGDDVDGVTVSNAGTGLATDAYYIADTGPAGSKWLVGFHADTDMDVAFRTGAHDYDYGLDLADGTFAEAPIYLPNNASVAAKTAAGAKQNLFKLNASDVLEYSARTSGIPFTATQVDSADANTLDDYEEGTWTPAITFATPGDLARTYSSQLGWYTKVGNVVNFGGIVTTSAFTHTTASGAFQVTGLPFTCNATMAGRVAAMVQGYTKANFTQVMATVNGSTTLMVFPAGGSAQTIANLASGDMPTGGTVSVRFGGVYII